MRKPKTVRPASEQEIAAAIAWCNLLAEQLANAQRVVISQAYLGNEILRGHPIPDEHGQLWATNYPGGKRTLRLDIDWWPASGVTHRSVQSRRKR